jgi:hypothetical protein
VSSSFAVVTEAAPVHLRSAQHVEKRKRGYTRTIFSSRESRWRVKVVANSYAIACHFPVPQGLPGSRVSKPNLVQGSKETTPGWTQQRSWF